MNDKKQGRLQRGIRRKRAAATVPKETRFVGRFFDWLIANEMAFVVLGGAVFGLLMMVTHLAVPDSLGVTGLKVLAGFWMFGIFAFVVVVTDGNRKYARSGGTIRTVSGAVTAVVIGLLMFAPSVELVGVSAAIGALLGATALHWVVHL
jgi:hypothetical protein